MLEHIIAIHISILQYVVWELLLITVSHTLYLFLANVRVYVAHLVELGLSASTGFKLE